MQFSLIICTYNRPESLLRLLDSVSEQETGPDEVLIVDGSYGNETRDSLETFGLQELQYYQVDEEDRGLTRQRNFGLSQVNPDSEVICFLDDDVVLEKEYFLELLKTYKLQPNAVGVGGYILDDTQWKTGRKPTFEEFEIDGYVRKLGSRNVLRKRLGLLSDQAPGIMPNFSNGFSTGFLPPSGKTYPVEYFMGGVASYRKEIFQKIRFSAYFEGYGLYEDMDFCLRASTLGQLYVNTAAKLHHLHEESGRPNKYAYGKMVVRNGWYVWRVKYPKPKLGAKIKWHSIVLLLSFIRLGNSLTTSKKKEAFTESLGRIVGWWSLVWNKPLEKK